MKYSIFIAIFIVLLFAGQAIAGGGWPQPVGEGYFKLSQSMIRAKQYFNPDGDLIDITTTSVYMTSIYGEFGIANRLTGLIYAPVFVRSTINNRESTLNGRVEPGDEFNGIGDFDLGLKYGLITKGAIPVSASLVLGLPIGKNVGGESELLQTGDGEFNQLLRLEASHSFSGAPIYATLLVGYNNRGSATFKYASGEETINYADQFQWGGEIGWTPSSKLLVSVKWLHLSSLDNGDDMGNTGSSSVFGNNISYFSITPEVNLGLTDNFGLSASVGTVMSAKNILAAPNINFGLYYTLK